MPQLQHGATLAAAPCQYNRPSNGHRPEQPADRLDAMRMGLWPALLLLSTS
jgi:hypothetical protein